MVGGSYMSNSNLKTFDNFYSNLTFSSFPTDSEYLLKVFFFTFMI